MTDDFREFVLESIPVAVFSTKSDGTIAYVSKNVYLIFGYSSQELEKRGHIRTGTWHGE